MAWSRGKARIDAMQDQGPEMAEDERMMSDVIEAAKHLRFMVEQVTPEEFRWQEANYDRDSLLGRELLYLAANNEWVRATEETIDIARSDAIETKIQVDIDLDRITHEAFHQRGGQLWLPVVVLPPLVRPGLPEPDPFITLTVTDAAGNLLATLPNADVRHRISAAMAEIIVNMAIAWWPPDQGRPPAATRDQRLVLSAAIYRLLLRERAALPAEDTTDTGTDPSQGSRANPAQGLTSRPSRSSPSPLSLPPQHSCNRPKRVHIGLNSAEHVIGLALQLDLPVNHRPIMIAEIAQSEAMSDYCKRRTLLA